MNKKNNIKFSRRNLMKAAGLATTSVMFNLSLKKMARAASEVTEEEKLRAISQIQGLPTFPILASKLQTSGLNLDMQDCYMQKHADDPNIWGLVSLAKEPTGHPKSLGFVSVTGSFSENRVIGINYDVRRGRFRKLKSVVGHFDLGTGAMNEQETSIVIDPPKETARGGIREVTDAGMLTDSLAPSRRDLMIYEDVEQIEQRLFTFPDGTTEVVDVELQRAATKPGDRATSASCWYEHQGPYFIGIGSWKLVWCGLPCGFIGGADSIWQNWMRKCCNPGGCGIWNGYTTRMSFNSSACGPICSVRN